MPQISWPKLALASLASMAILLASSPVMAMEGTPQIHPPASPMTDTFAQGTTGTQHGLSYAFRLGMSGNHALSTPNLYGLGSAAEATLVYGDRIAAGVRFDGVAMLGFGYTESYSVGVRFFAGGLGKIELLLGNPFSSIPHVGTGQTKVVLGAAFGTYRIAAAGGRVSRDVVEERRDGLDAFAIGGRAYGIAPQIGFQKYRFRLSFLSHLVVARDDLDPVFAVELAWQLL